MGFGDEIGAWTDKAQRRIRLFKKKIALDVFRRVIMRTPVGYPPSWQHKAPKGYVGGHARANWQTSVGSPADGTVESTDVNGPLNQMLPGMAAVDGDESIFLTNNLPYINRLEYGWSGQAPEGMVGITVAEFNGIAEEAMAQVKKEET